MRKWTLMLALLLCVALSTAQAEVASSPLGYEMQYEPALFQCELCGRFYPAGNIFRNHICVGAWPTLKADGGAELVLCELCGGWYEAGNVFRNHICTGAK